MERILRGLVLLTASFALLAGHAACATGGGWSRSVDSLVSDLTREYGDARVPAIAVFDMDNTLIAGDISFSFLEYQALHGRYGFDPVAAVDLMSPQARDAFARIRGAGSDHERSVAKDDALFHVFRKYQDLWESGRKAEACAYLARLLQGLQWEEARQLGRDALSLARERPRCLKNYASSDGEGMPFVEEIGIRLRPDMIGMVNRLRSAGWIIYVVSASPKPVVEAVAEAYGIPSNRVLAVEPDLDGNVLTDRIKDPVTYGIGKVEAIRLQIGSRPVLAFGDAGTDFEMLVHAVHAVLIDKGDPELARSLRSHGVLVQPPFPGETALEHCIP